MLPVSSFFIIKIKACRWLCCFVEMVQRYYLDSQIPCTGSALYSVINFTYFFFFACPKEKETKRKGSQSLGPSSMVFPALRKITGRCETRGVYTPLWGAQTVHALFRLFLSANILLPTIDNAALLREMAKQNYVRNIYG